MADLGDYVQHRTIPEIRGHVVNDRDGWLMVQRSDKDPRKNPFLGFMEDRDDYWIVLVKGK